MFDASGNRAQNRLPALRSLVLFLILLAPILPAGAHTSPVDTEVGGPLVGDTTWALADSPYIVTADVQVPVGVTLTIEPGVMVKFNEGRHLQVDGTLIARGNPDRLVIFTSSRPSPRPGDWSNIRLTSTAAATTVNADGDYVSGSILQHCVVEYGGSGATVNGAIEAYSLWIDRCAVRNNAARGIYDLGTAQLPARITDNVISGNFAASSGLSGKDGYGGGIYVAYGTISRNTISNNRDATADGGGGGGVYALHSTINDNVILGNLAGRGGDPGTACNGQGGGVYAEFSSVSGNTVKSNTAGWWCGSGGGIYANTSIVIDNLVNNNYTCYGAGGGIYAHAGTVSGNIVSDNLAYNGGGIAITGGVASGNTVRGNSVKGNLAGDGTGDGGGISVEDGGAAKGNLVTDNRGAQNGGGIFLLRATAGNNVVSRNQGGYGGGIYVRESTASDNTVTDNIANAGGGIFAEYNNTVEGNVVSGNSIPRCEFHCFGGGIYARESTVVSNTITANSVNPDSQGSGIYLSSSNLVLSNTIVGNTATSPTALIGGLAGRANRVSGNNIYGNLNYDVVGEGTMMNNYWGTTVHAEIAQHIYDGHDAPNLGYVDYVPYLEDPAPDAPVPPPLGLHAIFIRDTATLAWEPIPSTNAHYHYKVYYDDDVSSPPYGGTDADQGPSPVDAGDTSSFSLTGLSSYKVAVTALDVYRQESWYSNEVDNLKRYYLPSVTYNSAFVEVT